MTPCTPFSTAWRDAVGPGYQIALSTDRILQPLPAPRPSRCRTARR